MPKFSIIMPVFNSEKTLKKSIESILNQSFNDWELIIIDDGSTDRSLQIINSFIKADNRIKVIQQMNCGPGIARNNGISISEGDFIAFLDSDDYWDLDFLKLVVEVNPNEDKELIFWDRIYEKKNGKVLKYSKIFTFNQSNKYELLCRQMTGLIPWGMSKVISKKILCSIKGEFSKLRVGEEAVFSFDVLNKAKSVGFIEKPIYHYVQSENGQHKEGNLDPWKPVVEEMKNHLLEIDEYEIYESTINSFSLRALCISLYRVSNEGSTCFDAFKQMKKQIKEYSEIYDFKNLNRQAVDKFSIMILYLIKARLLILIYIASKLRKKKLGY